MIDAVKTCNKCLIEKNISDFYKSKVHKNGIKNHCKKCEAIAKKERTNKRRRGDIEIKKIGSKVCIVCNVDKKSSEFSKDIWNATGLASTCKECAKKASAQTQNKYRIVNEDYINDDIIEKKCPRCDKTKHISHFSRCKSRKDGYKGTCKECDKIEAIHIAEKNKIRNTNRGGFDKAVKNARCGRCKKIKNIDEFSFSISTKNGYGRICKQCALIKNKAYYSTAPAKKKKNKRNRKRNKTDVAYNIQKRVRSNFRDNLKRFIITKKKPINKYGIDIQSIVEHLGKPTGNIDNYHIDHIFPVTAFDFTDPLHIRICYHPTNLRWLDASENIKKGNRYNKVEFKKFFDQLKSLM